MSANEYGSIERGETDICLSRLEKIADVFGVDLTSLISCGDKIVYQMNNTGNNIGDYSTNYNPSMEHDISQIELMKEIISLLKHQLQ